MKKAFSINHLAILSPGVFQFSIGSEQDIVQFLTQGFWSLNDMDDKIKNESIQKELEKQLPGIRELLFSEEINTEAESRLLMERLRNKFGDTITVSSY